MNNDHKRTYEITVFDRNTQSYYATGDTVRLTDSGVQKHRDRLAKENHDESKVYGLRLKLFPKVKKWRTMDTSKETIPWYGTPQYRQK